MLVAATPEGRARFDKIYPCVLGALDDILAPLSLDERHKLRDLLSRLAI
jgi:hypothetical protein